MTIFMLYSTTLALLMVASAAEPSTGILDEQTHSLEDWFENSRHQKAAAASASASDTLTKLQIYIHAVFNTASPNQTVFQVASAEITPQSPSYFGRILVIDNPFTTGPDPGSRVLGQYQGINAYSDFNQASATMIMNIVFSGGSEYNGSTLSILGRQPVFEEVRVLSVIGGTGAFRLARGKVLATTYSSNPNTQTGVYMYRIFLLTPYVQIQTS